MRALELEPARAKTSVQHFRSSGLVRRLSSGRNQRFRSSGLVRKLSGARNQGAWRSSGLERKALCSVFARAGSYESFRVPKSVFARAGSCEKHFAAFSLERAVRKLPGASWESEPPGPRGLQSLQGPKTQGGQRSRAPELSDSVAAKWPTKLTRQGITPSCAAKPPLLRCLR